MNMIACCNFECSRFHCKDSQKEETSQKGRIHTMTNMKCVFLLVIISFLTLHEAVAFTAPGPRIPQNNRQQISINRMKQMNRATFSRRSGIMMYVPPTSTSQTAPMVAKSILSFGENRKRGNCFMSNSVLSDSDTLPSFQTAHGLLSPETVMRMEEITSLKNQRSGAVAYFLDTYREHGPMACLPMLSDPAVLPKLTEAMRDIV
mmetsp:Transcript_11160/g.14931  ORF Transcript_11160/g.14931 Transcript_11160/m.14931 type:complete len:204 (-) Transcript_11160:341-952(-)